MEAAIENHITMSQIIFKAVLYFTISAIVGICILVEWTIAMIVTYA